MVVCCMVCLVCRSVFVVDCWLSCVAMVSCLLSVGCGLLCVALLVVVCVVCRLSCVLCCKLLGMRGSLFDVSCACLLYDMRFFSVVCDWLVIVGCCLLLVACRL